MLVGFAVRQKLGRDRQRYQWLAILTITTLFLASFSVCRNNLDFQLLILTSKYLRLMPQLNLLMHVCEAWEETLVSFNVLLWLLRYPTQFHLPYITYSFFTSKEFCTFSRCVCNKLVGCYCRWLSFLSLHPKYGSAVQESMRYTHLAPWMSMKGWSHIWKFLGNMDSVVFSYPMLWSYMWCFSATHLFTLVCFVLLWQGWTGEGKERVSRKHSEGGFFYQEMSMCHQHGFPACVFHPSFMFPFIPIFSDHSSWK